MAEGWERGGAVPGKGVANKVTDHLRHVCCERRVAAVFCCFAELASVGPLIAQFISV